jgi:hypothetical protein
MHSHVEKNPDVHARKRRILAVIHLWNESQDICLSSTSSNDLPLLLCNVRVRADGNESSYWRWRLLVLNGFDGGFL